jgi:hypothetical protein
MGRSPVLSLFPSIFSFLLSVFLLSMYCLPSSINELWLSLSYLQTSIIDSKQFYKTDKRKLNIEGNKLKTGDRPMFSGRVSSPYVLCFLFCLHKTATCCEQTLYIRSTSVLSLVITKYPSIFSFLLSVFLLSMYCLPSSINELWLSLSYLQTSIIDSKQFYILRNKCITWTSVGINPTRRYENVQF